MENEPLESCSSFSLTGKAYVDLPLLYGALFATLSQREYAKRQKILIDKLFLALDSLSPKEQQAEQILLTRNLDHEFTTYLYQIRNLIHIKKEKEALVRIAPLENLFYLFEDNIRKRSDKPLAFRYYFSLMEKALAEKVYPDDNVFLLPFDGVSLYILKAQALFRSNRYEEGFLSLHQALELDPVSVDVLFLSAKENQKNNNDFSLENDLERIKEFLYRSEDYFRYIRLTFLSDDAEDDRYFKSIVKNNSTPYDFLHNPNHLFSILLPKTSDALLSDLVRNTYLEKIEEAEKEKNKPLYLYYVDNYSPFISPDERERLHHPKFLKEEDKKEAV